MCFCSFLLVLTITGANPVLAASEEKNAQESKASESEAEKITAKELPPFAKVNDTEISFMDYRAAMIRAVRSKFYHGKVPQGKMAALQREIGQELVDKILLLREAKKRNIEPDREWVDQVIANFDKKYGDSEKWKEQRDQVVPGLIKKLEEDSLVQMLEKQVRESPNPTEDDVRKYYEEHPEKFTEPEQVKVSAILLKVDPSSPKEVWDEAVEEAKKIIEKIKAGADFAELAKIHSGDPSAEQGGDMGYLHRGMLAEIVHKTLDETSVGDITDPVVILQGVGIFRLDDRKVAKLNEFENVRERARGLLMRELSDKAWENLKAEVRQGASVEINESYYLPLPDKTQENQGEGGDAGGGHAGEHGPHGG